MQKNSILFELHKDDEDEKKFTRTDFQSIVTRAEYRTETYLAQIFYLSVSVDHHKKLENILKVLNLAPQELGEPPENLEIALPAEEQKRITAGSQSKTRQKRLAALFLVIYMFLGIFIMIFSTLKDFFR